MADYFQNGVISTIQKVKQRPLEDLEQELRVAVKKSKIALLLPALYSEFERPAMHKIIEELRGADYIERVVLSLDQANKEQFEKVKGYLSDMPMDVKIVWNHGDRLQRMYQKLMGEGFPVNIPGKGRVVWMAMGYLFAADDIDVIALHDCDIVNYDRELLVRLVYPLVMPGLRFEFNKGYYARVTDKLYGRVTRMFFTPLIRALLHILRKNEFIEYLDSFRYALSGEFAMQTDLARGMRISPTWGLEVATLSEVYENTAVNRICQTEIMETYEHKHSGFSKNAPKEGLMRMSTDIAKTLFRILTQDGIVLSESFFRTMTITYTQEARKAVDKYEALSRINGIQFDRHGEIQYIEAFTLAIKNAVAEFIENPVGVRYISAWVRVESAMPDFMEQMYEYVENDNK